MVIPSRLTLTPRYLQEETIELIQTHANVSFFYHVGAMNKKAKS